jgi:hypothetical protein
MTGPDYPLLTIPGYELYQFAHLATFIVDALARHRAAAQQGDRAARRAAARDVHAGRLATARATGTPDLAGGPLPRPLDTATYQAAQGLLAGQPEQRHAQVVSLAALGRTSWAVVGHIPQLGPVGAEVPTQHLAAALREHLLTRPTEELQGFAVTTRPASLGVDRWRTADEAAAVAALDPRREQHAYVALALQGISAELDSAIDERFREQAAPRTPAQPVAASSTAQGGSSVAGAQATASGAIGTSTNPSRNGFPAAARALPEPAATDRAGTRPARSAQASMSSPSSIPPRKPVRQPTREAGRQR